MKRAQAYLAAGDVPDACDAPNWLTTTDSGGRYTASLWVRSDTPGATLKLKLREYWKNNGAFVAEAKSAGALTNTWQQATGTFEPAPTAAC